MTPFDVDAFVRLFPGVSPKNTPDQKTKEELWNYEEQNQKFDIDYKRSFLKARKTIGYFSVGCVWLWLFITLAIICINGMGRVPLMDRPFKLTDTLLITLITTTTVNVLAILIIIIRNLYPQDSRK